MQQKTDVPSLISVICKTVVPYESSFSGGSMVKCLLGIKREYGGPFTDTAATPTLYWKKIQLLGASGLHCLLHAPVRTAASGQSR